MSLVHGAAAAVVAIFTASAFAQAPRLDEVRRLVALDSARFADAAYARTEIDARSLRDRIAEFLAAPDQATLDRARAAWVHARKGYCMTEVLRFYDGPIDNAKTGVETYLNAWPLDESYIDSVRGNEDAGIINAVDRYPQLGPELLTLANERGGGANICSAGTRSSSCSPGWQSTHARHRLGDLDASLTPAAGRLARPP